MRRCPVVRWQGTVWRMHRRRYQTLDETGTRLTSGRYHRAPAQFAYGDCWAALYLSLVPEVTIGEVLRNTPAERMSQLNMYRLSEISVKIQTVIDCRALIDYGVPFSALVQEGDFTLTQEVALHAFRASAEGILVPSATRLGDNLVVFPDNLREGSRLEVVGSRDPVLYVDRADS